MMTPNVAHALITFAFAWRPARAHQQRRRLRPRCGAGRGGDGRSPAVIVVKEATHRAGYSAHGLQSCRIGRAGDPAASVGPSPLVGLSYPPLRRRTTGILSNLVTALMDQFHHGGSADDLNYAIDLGENAIAAPPRDHPYPPGLLSNLGAALLYRFRRSAGETDLERAKAVLEEAIALTTIPTERAGCLTNLAGGPARAIWADWQRRQFESIGRSIGRRCR